MVNDLNLGINLGYWTRGPEDHTAAVVAADELGYDYAFTAEAYGSDAFSTLAWYGSRTKRIKLGTAVAQIPARTPTATAMHALTIDGDVTLDGLADQGTLSLDARGLGDGGELRLVRVAVGVDQAGLLAQRAVLDLAAGRDALVLVVAGEPVAGDGLEVGDAAERGDVSPGALHAVEPVEEELVGDVGEDPADAHGRAGGLDAASERRVEVDEVDPGGPLRHPLPCRVERVAVARLGPGFPLRETDRLAAGDIDRGKERE